VEVVRASIAAILLIRLEIAQTRALQHVITAADRDTSVENVLYRQRKSLATGAMAPGIFRVIAPNPAAVEDSVETVETVGILMVAAAVAIKNATSVGRLAILLAIAAKVEGLGLHTAVLTALEAVAVNRLATLAVVMVTWPETVHKVKNATTAAKSAMSRVTALPKPAVNVYATNASNLVTSKRPVPTKFAGEIPRLGRLFWIMRS
jgi:hypothetical protein